MGKVEDPEMEKRLNRAYYIGQVAGLDEAAKLLRSKALDAFDRRQDSTALLLREMAEELTRKSGERRKEADTKFGE